MPPEAIQCLAKRQCRRMKGIKTRAVCLRRFELTETGQSARYWVQVTRCSLSRLSIARRSISFIAFGGYSTCDVSPAPVIAIGRSQLEEHDPTIIELELQPVLCGSCAKERQSRSIRHAHVTPDRTVIEQRHLVQCAGVNHILATTDLSTPYEAFLSAHLIASLCDRLDVVSIIRRITRRHNQNLVRVHLVLATQLNNAPAVFGRENL